MEKIRNRLLALGKTATDDQIRMLMSEYGVGDDLSDADANAIAEEMAEDAADASGLTRSNSKSQPTKQQRTASGKGQVSRKEELQINQAAFKSASVSAAQKSREEIEALRQSIEKGTAAYAEAEADAILGVIRSAPNQVLAIAAQRMNQEVSDPESFRQMGADLCQSVFGDVFSTATE